MNFPPLHELVRLSNIAYDPYTVAKRALLEDPVLQGYEVWEYFDVEHAQGYLFGRASTPDREGRASLSFRGTEASGGSLGDVASNAYFHAGPWYGPGRVHPGYLNQYDELRGPALLACSRVVSEMLLYVSGHSMGGAIAGICAADIFGRGWKFAGLVAFGPPKSLDKEAMATIRCPILRVHNRFDFAQWYPPSLSLTGLRPTVGVDSGGWVGSVTRHMPHKYIVGVDRYMKERGYL